MLKTKQYNNILLEENLIKIVYSVNSSKKLSSESDFMIGGGGELVFKGGYKRRKEEHNSIR